MLKDSKKALAEECNSQDPYVACAIGMDSGVVEAGLQLSQFWISEQLKRPKSGVVVEGPLI